MTEKWNEKWLKNANCEQPYYIFMIFLSAHFFFLYSYKTIQCAHFIIISILLFYLTIFLPLNVLSINNIPLLCLSPDQLFSHLAFFHYFHFCFLFIYSVHFSVFFRFADSCLHFQPLFIFTSSIFSYFFFCYLFSDPYIFLSDFDFFFCICTVAQKTAPMFAYYIKTHVLLNADII